ncbi:MULTISPECIES: HK97-gp10 family putative phage morphogenesis protein [unclassified Pseudomonas]|uniref:HK97-gp10 family putative phage morphogenesis protein n=1 Tax=unclassified Pseudomonas TaxID=196821 RepID=UPI00131E9BFA|nr:MULTISPECIES: HK97-gp10 family putative phage morphogenesis protein [unclassified Pseudomonas]
MITFTLTGVDDAIDRLSKLPEKIQKRSVRRAAREAMKIVRDEAIERANIQDRPDTPMNIADFIVIREGTIKGRRAGGIVMRVGVMGGARYDKNSPNPTYWRFVEFGTEKAEARPFMRPALDNNVPDVIQTFVDVLNDELNKEMV